MNHSLTRILSAALVLWVGSAAATAQPVLIAITHNPQAHELIIQGSAFGPGPNVVLFDNFEHEDKFADQLGKKSSDWSDSVMRLKEPSGNHAHRAKDPVTVKGRKGMPQITINFQKVYHEAYIAYSVKVPPGTTFAGASEPKTFSTMSSWKFTWLMLGSNGFQEKDDFDICLPSHVGGGSFLLGGNDGNLTWIDKGSQWWAWDEYNHMTAYIRFNPEQPNDKPVHYFWTVTNPTLHRERVGEMSPTDFRSPNLGFDRIKIPGWWGNGDNDRFDGLYDNLYVAVGDNARARVVITDSPDYDKSKFAVTVMPASWADDRVILHEDVLPAGENLFVHLFDKAGKRSEQALKLNPAPGVK